MSTKSTKLKKISLSLVLSYAFYDGELISNVQANLDTMIRVSKKVPLKQRNILEKDLKRFKELHFNRPNERTLKALGLDQFDSDLAFKWLTDRVKLIVAPDEIKDDLSNLTFQNKHYNNLPLPRFDQYNFWLPEPPSIKKTYIVMSNRGAAIYRSGKRKKKIYTYETPYDEFEKIVIDSPRAGIIQIGEGLFMNAFSINRDKQQAFSNTIDRIAVFFHEARHSDGHGEHLGFFHDICPIDHDYVGLAACDRNLNGPYSVGAQMYKEMIKSCNARCSVSEKESLRHRYLSAQNRVIQESVQIIDHKLNQILLHQKELIAWEQENYLSKWKSFMEKTKRQSKQRSELEILYRSILFSQENLFKQAIAIDAVDYIPSQYRNPIPEKID